MPSISVMLTAYKRTMHLADQIDAIRNQSIDVKELWLWNNCQEVLPEMRDVDQTITAVGNLGVWPRFTAALEMDSEFVCIFDDDTLPGRRWLENCMANYHKQPGLYGTIGVVFPPSGRRRLLKYGWNRPSMKRKRVDIVGHSWFLRRERLRTFAAIPRPMRSDGSHYRTCGEDYFLSYALQTIGISTYVPPHPPDDRELWGSLYPARGRDRHALWKQPGAEEEKLEFHNQLRGMGWELLRDNCYQDV